MYALKKDWERKSTPISDVSLIPQLSSDSYRQKQLQTKAARPTTEHPLVPTIKQKHPRYVSRNIRNTYSFQLSFGSLTHGGAF